MIFPSGSTYVLLSSATPAQAARDTQISINIPSFRTFNLPSDNGPQPVLAVWCRESAEVQEWPRTCQRQYQLSVFQRHA
jgi:hypothetical protein